LSSFRSGAELRIIRPSSGLPEGFEVMFDQRLYNVLEIDLVVRSTPICEPIRVRSVVMAAPRSAMVTRAVLSIDQIFDANKLAKHLNQGTFDGRLKV